jgi:hypothetical protein
MPVYHRLGDGAAERRCDGGSMRPDVMLAAQCFVGDRGVPSVGGGCVDTDEVP